MLYGANPELNTVALSEQVIKGNSSDGFRMLEAVGAKMGEGPFIKSAYDEAGGFYGAYLQSASWGTIGGALTDRQFHVLDENDAPIENLFAVGEMATSTLFGDYYLGGFSLGYYSAAGRIAAQTAVEEINKAK